ncbi:hypothetical protein C8R45DRAFT_1073693 [Mycena sanguinolenta]|nr:hypothetical protein C8R45DRAFT_1073693 [Mycena sanguinolenta]
MPTELLPANQLPPPAPTMEATPPAAPDTAMPTLAVEDADAPGTATDDLLLAETLRDCLASLPQSLLLLPNNDSETDPTSTPGQADPVDEPESEVVEMAKLLRRALYIMAGLGDPMGVYGNSSGEENAPFATGNNVKEIIRNALFAVMVMQTIRDQQNAPRVDSPDLGTSPSADTLSISNPQMRSNPNTLSTPNPQTRLNPDTLSTPNPQTRSDPNTLSTPNLKKKSDLTFGQLMGNTSGPPWGNDVMKPLCEALYTEPFDETRMNHLECIAESYDVAAFCEKAIKTSDDYINRIRCLVAFLEQNKGNGTVAEFLDVARAQIPGWELDEKEYSYALYNFWNLFHWPQRVPDSGVTFKDKVNAIFPPLQKHKRSPDFSATLSDIFAAGLEIAPTQWIHEHLLVTDNEVKIFCPSVYTIRALDKFHTNRGAIALQIETLGGEIFSSLYVLYGQKRELDRARSLQLLPKHSADDYDLLLKVMFELHALINKPKPQVLASRVLALDKLVHHRRSWMVSLIRDIKTNQQEQPFLFWGSVVALLFGICTVIQTVTSVWSLQLALTAS